jgi:hypothetical protein
MSTYYYSDDEKCYEKLIQILHTKINISITYNQVTHPILSITNSENICLDTLIVDYV